MLLRQLRFVLKLMGDVMKQYYVAAFMPAQDGGFDILIPDIPGASAAADDLGAAYSKAQKTLARLLREMAGEKKSIPQPSTIEAVRKKTAWCIAQRGHDPQGEVLYQLIPAPNLDMAPVKVTISLPKSILDEIDAKAREGGLTRSGLISRAAMAYKV